MQIDASVNYHVTKRAPQSFEFDVDGIIGNLVSPELVTTDIKVKDLRDSKRQPDFQHDGIEFINQPSAIHSFESENSWEDTYNQELINLLKTRIGAKEVIVFDHTAKK